MIALALPLLSSNLTILSPANNTEVEYSYITLKVKTTGLYRVSAKNISMGDSFYNTTVEGVEYRDDYLLYNIPLQDGVNEINVSLQLKENLPDTSNSADNSNSISNKELESKILTISSLAQGMPLRVNMDPRNGYKKVTSTISVITKLNNIRSYYYDIDGDGTIDKTSKSPTLTKEFIEGAYKPIVTVETEDNILYSSNPLYTMPLLVSNEPEPKAVEILNGLEIRDMQLGEGGLYILTPNRVYILDLGFTNHNYQESIKHIIELANVNNPQGFFIASYDGKGLINDIYIADTGNNRVVRYLKKDNYQQDPDYELRHDFNQPFDLTIGDNTIDVLDRGNNRIVSFRDNQFESIFTGEGTNNGRLQNPINFIHSTYTYLLDRDGKLIRNLGMNYDIENDVLINSILHDNFGKLTNAYFIANTNQQELLDTHRFTKLKSKIKLNCSPTIAMYQSFNNELDKVYFACQEKKGLFYIEPYAKPKGARAIDIANKFVDAIKSKNIFSLMHHSLYNPKLVFSMNLFTLSDILKKTKKVKIGKHPYYRVATYYTDYKINNQKVKVTIHLKKANGTFIKTKEWYVDRIKLLPIKDEK